MWVRVVIAIVLLLLPTSVFAQAEKRIALLIGNQGYADTVGPLQNPHKDIALVGHALTDVGFNVLGPLKDATRDDMLFGVHELAIKLRQAGEGAIGFLYYTGHGVSVGVDNVLVPKNARNTSDAELDVRGVKLGEILDILKRGAPDAVHFVVLDACRNNIRGKKGAKGFVAVSDHRTGVVLAFATAAGETASDEGTTSGPYAAALAEEIVKPGYNDQAVFNAVRARVVAATRGQTPWTYDGLVGERIVFKAKAPEPAIGQRPAISTPGGAMEVVRICREVEAMTSLSMLAVLDRQHAGTPAADCISARIGELKAAQVAVAKAAEEKAEAAAKRRTEDEARKAEEDRRRAEDAERKRIAALKAEEDRQGKSAQSKDPTRERLILELTSGKVVIQLRPDLAPKHVEQVKRLTSRGFYDGIIFHRVIENFIAQTGDPTGTGTGGSKLPDLKAEFTSEPFKRGSVGAARTSKPDTANSQFFICFDGCRLLTGQYTQWGEVIEGMDYVDKLARGEPPASPDKILKATIARK